MKLFCLIMLCFVVSFSCNYANRPFIKIFSSLDGRLFVDGVDKGFIKAGKDNIKKIPVSSGELLIVIKSVDKKDIIDTIIRINQKDMVLYLNLNSVRNDRINFEREIENLEKNMVTVEGGSFNMGCTENDELCEDSERPAHKVNVSSFKISKYEVTLRQFDLFIKKSGYETTSEKEGWSWTWEKVNKSTYQWKKKDGLNWMTDDQGKKINESDFEQPVNFVSWLDAQAFCEWLSKETGKKYRLPTESEWEFAARGGNKTKGYIYSGSNNFDRVAWFYNNSYDEIHKVGFKAPNELGLYDMSGNVWEWCSVWQSEYKTSEYNYPTGSEKKENKVLRGGGFDKHSRYCRVSARVFFPPSYRTRNDGFRIVQIP